MPRDEQVFMQGVLYGLALAACRQQHDLTLLDKRITNVERSARPALRMLRRLVVVGRRDGKRIYRMF